MSTPSDPQPPKMFAERIAATLIEQLKAGTAPWQRPWEDGPMLLPFNPVTGKRYRGINTVSLMLAGRGDARWLTYRQAQTLGAQVRKGERSSSVQYWKFHEESPKLGASGAPVLDPAGKPIKQIVELERPRVFYAAVFNAEQIDGLPALEPKLPTWNPVERAEQIVRNSNALITHGGNSASYSPASDRIRLPEKGQFPDAARYYATALHELGHWTGHTTRLGRDLAHPFGSEGYAREELRAEIASMMLGSALGLGHDPGQHAAYVRNWCKVLADDPLEIVRAAADAEKIHEYVLALEHELTPELSDALHDSTLQQLEFEHALSNSAASTLVTWRNLEVAAQALGLKARLSPAPAGHSQQVLVRYATADGAISPVRTVLSLDGGDALTLLNGVRVEGTRLTSDPAAQLAALRQGVSATGASQPSRDRNETRPATPEATQAAATPNNRTYIAVPYKDRHEARAAGARWDRAVQRWFYSSALPAARFAKWTLESGQREERLYLAVPYADRHKARACGARWDRAAKAWYVDASADRKPIDKWLPERSPQPLPAAPNPRDEFAQALRELGCVVVGEHPIMDGKSHRLQVEGDRRGEKGGFYVAHLDGLPAGFIENHRTGAKYNWKCKGYEVDQATLAGLRADAAQKLQDRAHERAAREQSVAKRLAGELASLAAVTTPTPYLQSRGVSVHRGLYTNAEGTTIVPATDVDGALWTVQYIDAEGTKRFAKGARKSGCFHVVGGIDRLSAAPVVAIAEGYATAATASELLGHPVVAAFDAGNLLPVATALREKYPDKPILILGDDDQSQQQRTGRNPGRTKAQAAADAVGGTVLLPTFAPGEQERAPSQFSDFNDLATRSVLGRDGARSQLEHAWQSTVERAAAVQTAMRRALECGEPHDRAPLSRASR